MKSNYTPFLIKLQLNHQSMHNYTQSNSRKRHTQPNHDDDLLNGRSKTTEIHQTSSPPQTIKIEKPNNQRIFSRIPEKKKYK